jgi:hypothetical protein
MASAATAKRLLLTSCEELEELSDHKAGEGEGMEGPEPVSKFFAVSGEGTKWRPQEPRKVSCSLLRVGSIVVVAARTLQQESVRADGNCIAVRVSRKVAEPRCAHRVSRSHPSLPGGEKLAAAS